MEVSKEPLFTMTVCVVTSLIIGCGAVGSESAPVEGAVATEISQLIADYQRDSQEFFAALENAKTPEARKSVLQNQPESFVAAKQVMELIAANTNAADSIDGLVFVAEAGVREGLSETAISRLLAEHFSDPKMESVCVPIGASADRVFAESTLKRLMATSPHEAVRGMATFCLAKCLETGLETEKSEVEVVVNTYRAFIKDYAETQFEQGDLISRAQDAILKLTELAMGSPAPEIEGKDLDGIPLRLSDYRGKVVLLHFWGDWCSPCRALYEHQRSLVDQLAGQPFVIIGVNNDPDLESISRIIKDKKLNWRNFRDSHDSQIADDWRVAGWPTSYLIDAEGTLRHKNLRGNSLDAAIESLLAEMGLAVDIKKLHQ